jgi:acyl-CoA thioesterase
MEFLRPATGKKIYCVATPKKMGRSLSTIQVSLTNDEGVEVATGTFTFFMLDV